MSADLVSLLADLKEEAVLGLTRTKLEAGEDPMQILEDRRTGL